MDKLLKIQSELKAPKWQMNKFGWYRYRSCEDIQEAVKPILYKYNCSLFLSDKLVQIWERYYIEATCTFIDNDSKESLVTTAYAREEEVKKWMDSSQITWASSSYARKYALNWLFLIDDTKDSDATNDNSSSSASTMWPLITKINNEIASVKDTTWLLEIASKIKSLKESWEIDEASSRMLLQSYNKKQSELWN